MTEPRNSNFMKLDRKGVTLFADHGLLCALLLSDCPSSMHTTTSYTLMAHLADVPTIRKNVSYHSNLRY